MRDLIQAVAEKAMADTDFGTVGNNNFGAAALIDHALVHGHLLNDGAGDTTHGADTTGPQETFAGSDLPGGADGEFPHQALLVAVDLTAGEQQVNSIRTLAVESTGVVGDDAGMDVCQIVQNIEHRGAAVEEHRIPAADHAGGLLGDGQLSGCGVSFFRLILHVHIGRQDVLGSAEIALDATLLFQIFQIPTDGGCGDLIAAGKLRDIDRLVLLQELQNVFTPEFDDFAARFQNAPLHSNVK